MSDAERDPVEWAQHTALVAISVARTVLDMAEAAVADRQRIERLATSGRSAADTWLHDALRLASTLAAGFGFDPPGQAANPKPPAPTAAPPAPAATVIKARPVGKSPPPRKAPSTRPRPAKAATKAKKSTSARSKKRKR